MSIAVTILLALTSTVTPLPIPQGGTDTGNAIKTELAIDSLTHLHEVYTSEEFLTPSTHGKGGPSPFTDIVCLITLPVSNIVALLAGLPVSLCMQRSQYQCGPIMRTNTSSARDPPAFPLQNLPFEQILLDSIFYHTSRPC